MKRLTVITMLLFTVLLSILVTGCSMNINGFGAGSSNLNETHMQSRSEDYSQPAGGLEKLEVFNGVGNITVEKANVREIKLHSDIEVRSKNEETSKEIIDNVTIGFEKTGNSLKINVNTDNDPDQEFWEWLRRTYHSANVTVNLTIQIPEGIKQFYTNNGVGDIAVSGLKGSLSTATGTGDITLSSCSLLGHSELRTGTGNVSVSADLKQANTLKVNCGVGNINVDLPGDTGFVIDANTGVGSITGSMIKASDESIAASVDQVVNGGGTELRLGTGTGNIRVD